MRPSSPLKPRRKSRLLHVGAVPVGGDSPISVQSMTNTQTADTQATIQQIQRIAEAGADMVRVSVPTMEAAESFKAIKKAAPIPLIADIHFDYKIALKVADYGADCLRINPGNIGGKARVQALVAAASHKGIPIRIGVNAGSLEKHLLEKYGEPCAKAMTSSALEHANILENEGFTHYKISLKASNVPMMVEAYEATAKETDAPLHLGVTEAGTRRAGTIKSAVGIGTLLMAGIGDTLRVSLAEAPEEEVRVGFGILSSLGLRHLGAELIACPSCSRQAFPVVETCHILEGMLETVRLPMTVSMIGCIVNGPGEAKVSDIGITGGNPNHLLYIGGKIVGKIPAQETPRDLAEKVFEQVLAVAESFASSRTNTIARSS